MGKDQQLPNEVKKKTPKKKKRPGYTTIKECEAAIRSSGGMMYTAAKKLGISLQALYERTKKHPELQAVRDEVRESYKDLAESKLVKLVNEDNLGAICFLLKCLAKDRGYVETVRNEHSGAEGGPIPIIVAVGRDPGDPIIDVKPIKELPK